MVSFYIPATKEVVDWAREMEARQEERRRLEKMIWRALMKRDTEPPARDTPSP